MSAKLFIIEEQYFSKEIVDVEIVKAAFIEKYGNKHVLHHFQSAALAIALRPLKYGPFCENEIQNIFDSISSSYAEEVTKNPVQNYMRQRTSSVLMKYVRSGDSVLDLGSGPMLETLEVPFDIELTAADISGGMLYEAEKRARNRGRFNVAYVKTDMHLAGNFSQYDIIFTTFGLLELLSPKTIAEFASKHLKGRRILILSFWNKFGLMDNILSVATGRGLKYFKQKLTGKVYPGRSRFPVEVLSASMSEISKALPADPVEKEGICLVVPPYCYTNLIGKFRFDGLLTAVDSAASKLPGAWLLCDYVVAVFRL